MTCDRSALLPVILDATPTDLEVVILAAGMGASTPPSVVAIATDLRDALLDQDEGQGPYMRALVLTDDDDLTALAAAIREAREEAAP